MRGRNTMKTGARMLAWLTRLVFLLLVIFSIAQITCTVVFILMCRQSSRDLVLNLDLSTDPCQSQGIPAYIASIVLVVTVFGFGCVGRKCTSVAIMILGLCDVGISIYLQVNGSTEIFSSVEQDLNRTVTLCSETDIHNNTYSEHDSKTCNNIHSTLVQFCPTVGEWWNWNRTLNNESKENCSRLIQKILADIKFQYYPYSVPLTFCGSISYLVLSMFLFYIQYRDRQLPGYHHREHMLHVPEFYDHPSAENSTGSGPRLTVKSCLIHVLYCRCLLLFHKQSCACCRLRQSTRAKGDEYEFEALPVKVANVNQSHSDTQLV